MAWNFRKRIKIAPGIHLNISKGGVSTSVGPKGAKINIGRNGTYLNTSILGTGLYSRQKISGNSSMLSNNTDIKTDQTMGESNENEAFFKPKNTWGCVFRWLGLIAIVFLVIKFIQSNQIIKSSNNQIIKLYIYIYIFNPKKLVNITLYVISS